MKSNILIIEDVKELNDLMTMYLSKEGMTVEQAESAEIAFEKLKTFTPDLVILDLNLPGMDGFEFLSKFRKTYNTHVIIVSARDADEDIITGYGYGADDFEKKPFSPRVLTAKVRSALRRENEKNETLSGKSQTSSEIIKFGPYELNCESYTLRKFSKDKNCYERIMLSAKEFDVLEFLAKNPNKPFSPEEIFNKVWGNMYGDLSTVGVYIQRLRKKIEADSSNPVYIKTIFGLGYKFNLEK